MVLYDISMAKMRFFFVVENRLLKSGPSWEKWGKIGEKSPS